MASSCPRQTLTTDEPCKSELADWFSLSDSGRIQELSLQDGNALLARGAFGEISVAIDTATSQRGWSLTAVKTIQRATISIDNASSDPWGSGGVVITDPTKQQLTPEVFNELVALRLLNPHPCVVTLLAVFSSSSQRALPGELSLAFSYSPIDLRMVLDRRRSLALPPLSFDIVKALAKDILLALQHCHSHGVIHCDISPGNLLLSSKGRVQLCDFGLAKPCPSLVEDDERSSGEATGGSKGLCTLHHRPPEVLLGSSFCHSSGDIYSAGLVVAELLLGVPLFAGKSVLDQLAKTFQVLGTPTDGHWPGARNMPDYGKVTFPPTLPQSWTEAIPISCECPHLQSWLSCLIALDPATRCSAAESMKHEWLSAPPLPVSSQELAENLISDELKVPPVLFSSPNAVNGETLAVAKKHAAAVALARRAYLAKNESSSWKSETGEEATLSCRLRQVKFTGELAAALHQTVETSAPT